MSAKKHIVSAISALCIFASASASETETDEYASGLDHWYAGAAAGLNLPAGDSALHRTGSGIIRFGWYANDFWALDFSLAQCENVFAYSGGALWHWWGYERLDPFFTFGLEDFIEKDCGPYLGTGTFWHFDDHWSLRCDMTAFSGLDHGGFLFSFSAGLRRSW
ncbi:MAG: hypothetical protein J6P13_04365 [Kiritimatiellae bacterium]|nr:hypothetical protein [Kiritimatiellia bacterium]